jgi:hypothetical protein
MPGDKSPALFMRKAMTGTRAIDHSYRVLALAMKSSPHNHSIIRRIEIMQKQIRLLFVAASLLLIPATLPTFAQDKTKDKDKMENQDKMAGDKMEDKEMAPGNGKMKGKMAKKNKKNKKGDQMGGEKMKDNKMKDDKMEEKRP